MSTPEERKQNDLKVDFIIDQAAGTDKNAVEYLTLLSQALRTIDDIYDEFEIGHAKMKEINSLIRPLFKKELEQ
jgi:hypothetical protein